MKRCPQCDLTYIDESLNFCLTDGAALVPLTAESQPTVVIPTTSHHPVGETPPPPLLGQAGSQIQPSAMQPVTAKKSKALLWVGLAAMVLLAGGVVAVAALFYVYSGRGAVANANRTNASPSPKPSATARVTPSPTATSTPVGEPSPTIEGSKPTPDDEEADEITPIAWTTSAAGFKGENGQIYKFQCPENGTAGTIWGNDVYTQDSSICTAAVHAGVISLERGGLVTVEFRSGRKTYGSTVRNGITSNTFGEYPRSFVVR